MEDQVAVFFDFENVVISAEETYGRCELAPIIEAAERWGRCIIKRAYGDWTRFDKYKQELIAHSIELIQLFHYGAQQKKNAADIQMVVDALETAFTHPDISAFVLVTGDSDFSAVARKLRAYGKQVVGIGLRKATSEVLVKACDHFVLYDTLIEPQTRTLVYTLERGRQLLLDAMRRLPPQPAEDGVLATRLKQTMLAQDPTFNELTLGFGQFKEFLEAQADVVKTSTRGETELIVALKPSAEKEPPKNGTAHYRMALDTAGLRLLDPHTRTEVLQDLFHLLSQHPSEFTLDQAVLQLKAQYDTTNVLRSRDEVQEVAKLVKYADVLEPRPQSWELDSLTLKPELEVQAMVDRCESAYITALLQNNLAIEPDSLAHLLFGRLDQRARVEHLTRLAQESLPEKPRPLHKVTGWEWPPSLRERPELQVVFQDLENCSPDETPTVAEAQELNNKGLQIRTTDFEQARGYFLRAARMMYDLLRRGEPGASLTDLKWYLASYCAATAGAAFFRYDYSLASRYYLAFFSLARETDPVWDKVHKLVQPMLSFYFTVAANESGQMLDVQPGRTHPARMTIILHDHPDPGVRERWLQLARDLARVNQTVLRTVIQRLEAMELHEELPGAREARHTLAELVRQAG